MNIRFGGNYLCARSDECLPAKLRNGEPTANLARKKVRNFGVSGHGFHLSGVGVASERMCAVFAFEIAAVQAQVAQEQIALHCTVTVS